MLGVPATELRRLRALLELFARELPHGLQHPVAQPTLARRLGHHERFVHERRQQVQHQVGLDRIAGPYGLGGLQVPTPANTESRGTAPSRPRPATRSSTGGSP